MGEKIEIKINYSAVTDRENEMQGANFIANIYDNVGSKLLVKFFYPQMFCEQQAIPRRESGCPCLFGASEEIVEEFGYLRDRAYKRLRNFNLLITETYPELFDYCRPMNLVLCEDEFGTNQLKVLMPFDMSVTADRFLEETKKTKSECDYLHEVLWVLKEIAQIVLAFHNRQYAILDLKFSNFVVYGPEHNRRLCLIDYDSIRKIQRFDVCEIDIEDDGDDEKTLELLEDKFNNTLITCEEATRILADLELSSTLQYATSDFVKLVEYSRMTEGDIRLYDLNATLNKVIGSEEYDWKVFGRMARSVLLDENVDFALFNRKLELNLRSFIDKLVEEGTHTAHTIELIGKKTPLFAKKMPLDRPMHLLEDSLSHESSVVEEFDSLMSLADEYKLDELHNQYVSSVPFTHLANFSKKEDGFEEDDLIRLSEILIDHHVVYITPESKNAKASISFAKAYLDSCEQLMFLTKRFKEWEKSGNEDKKRYKGMFRYPVVRYLINAVDRNLFEALATDLKFNAVDPLKNGDIEYLIHSVNSTINTEGGVIAFYIGSRSISDEDDLLISLLINLGIDVIVVSDSSLSNRFSIGDSLTIDNNDNRILIDEMRGIELEKTNKRHLSKSANDRFVKSALALLAGPRLKMTFDEFYAARESLYSGNIDKSDLIECIEMIDEFEMELWHITRNLKWFNMNVEDGELIGYAKKIRTEQALNTTDK